MKQNTYEGMFLFDPAAATRWENVESEVRRILERAEAEIFGIKKWDERRLAYEIEHRKRGCYALAYFRAPGAKIAGIERDARLSEVILRLLVVTSSLTDEQLGEFRIEAAEQSAFLRSKDAEVEAAPPEAAPAPRAQREAADEVGETPAEDEKSAEGDTSTEPVAVDENEAST